MGRHSIVSEPPAGYAKYIGRVGALAVALGVGGAVATGHGTGMARADDDTATTDGASDDAPPDPSTPSAPESGDQLDTQSPATGSKNPEPKKTAAHPADTRMDVDSSGSLDDSVNDEG